METRYVSYEVQNFGWKTCRLSDKKEHLGDLGTDVGIILKLILKNMMGARGLDASGSK
jgi:hypothetical protein